MGGFSPKFPYIDAMSFPFKIRFAFPLFRYRYTVCHKSILRFFCPEPVYLTISWIFLANRPNRGISIFPQLRKREIRLRHWVVFRFVNRKNSAYQPPQSSLSEFAQKPPWRRADVFRTCGFNCNVLDASYSCLSKGRIFLFFSVSLIWIKCL